jgi:putative SOS response-associated peptidase YedK
LETLLDCSTIEGSLIFGFLTTKPNAIVALIHPKAMPVILTTPTEVDRWLTEETPAALEPQRPLPEASLRIVALPALVRPPHIHRDDPYLHLPRCL